MNVVLEQGKLTDKPQIRYSLEGLAITRFSIAVPKKGFVKAGGATADFFNCTAFGKNAENINKFFNMGDTILVRGRLENDNYTTRDDVKVYSVVIIVDEWEFGPKKRVENGPDRSQIQSQGQY